MVVRAWKKLPWDDASRYWIPVEIKREFDNGSPVKRFLGFRSDLIFKSLKRIRSNAEKSLGPDAYQRGVLNE